MHTTIIVNMPVADVARSRKFFSELGYTINENLSSDAALTLVLGDNQYAMLLQRNTFDSLHPIETADAFAVKECVVCLSVESRDAVDTLVDRAIAAGATVGDTDDEADMYGRSYNDLDGHSWQIFWMGPAAPSTVTD